MGELIRNHDWNSTPFGSPADWPQSLRTSVSIVLNSKLFGAVLWGPELRIIYNDAYMSALAERHPAALGAPVAQVWGATYEPIAEGFNEAVRTGKGYGQSEVELPMLRNGSIQTTFWTGTASPIRGEDGSVAGLLNIAIETTDQVIAGKHRDLRQNELATASVKLAEDVAQRTLERNQAVAGEQTALQNAERVQLALAAGAIIGTWNWDLVNDSFTVDEAFATHFGFPDEMPRTALPLAKVVQTVHPDDQAGLASAIDEAIHRGGPYAHQYRVRRSDGNYYWLEANGRVDHDASGNPIRFPGVLIDVDARRALVQERDRAFEDLRQLNERLEQLVAERTEELVHTEEALRQSQKMEAIGQLTGGLAHDFNNLLAGITGALDLIELRIGQRRFDGLERYVGAAQDAASRAASLTHRLLAFSRRQTLSPKTTRVDVLIGGMLDLIQRTVGPSIRLNSSTAPNLWQTLVDPSQLENAVLNLCINARDAMPEGGQIDISTTNVLIDESLQHQLSIPPGEYLAIRVSDTGAGMTPDVLEKAFDPFFTTKPIGEGTGLGLSMIYGFAKQSGGQVRIKSQPKEGTNVTIYLPRHDGSDSAELPEASAPGYDPQSAPSQTVAFVDDEPSIRLLFKDVLEELGYQVIEAHDSISGLELMRSGVHLDLLISDVGLPGGMNGRQLADAARQLRPDLKVLFITGFAEAAVLEQRHLEPGMSVLAKPFGIPAFVARVREMLPAGS